MREVFLRITLQFFGFFQKVIYIAVRAGDVHCFVLPMILQFFQDVRALGAGEGPDVTEEVACDALDASWRNRAPRLRSEAPLQYAEEAAVARYVEEDDGIGDISNRNMLQILMQEIADVRKELKEDIANLDHKLTQRIDVLSSDVQVLSSDVQTLRLEVHQNQTVFLKNHDQLERRVAVLEAA